MIEIASPSMATIHFHLRAVARTLLFPAAGFGGDYAATKRAGGTLSGAQPPPPRFAGSAIAGSGMVVVALSGRGGSGSWLFAQSAGFLPRGLIGGRMGGCGRGSA